MKYNNAPAALRHCLNLLLPQSCAGCQRVLSPEDSGACYPICSECKGRIVKIEGAYCRHCGLPLISEAELCQRCRTQEASRVVSNRALYLYIDIAQKLIRAYKFSHQKRLAYFFAEEIATMITGAATTTATAGAHTESVTTDARAESAGAGTHTASATDAHTTYALVPIPGTPRNVRARGWDQTHVIAGELSARHHIPILHLFTHLRGKTQKKLNRAERAANANHTLALRRNARLPEGVRSLILFDDVYTTGATLHAAAEIVAELAPDQVTSITLSIAL